MNRLRMILAAVALALSTTTVSAQFADADTRFTSLSTYAVSLPLGDTRRYIGLPSFLGMGWDGQWSMRNNTAVGVALGVYDFYNESFSTTNFPSGSATGDQLRDLLVASVLATGRWYPLADSRGPYLGIGAGGIYAEQFYQLGIISQVSRAALHLVIAPEAGLSVPMMQGVNANLGVRYWLPNAAGNYVGGGARSFRFVTASIGLAERW